MQRIFILMAIWGIVILSTTPLQGHSSSYPEHRRMYDDNGKAYELPIPCASKGVVYPSYDTEILKQRLAEMTNNAVKPKYTPAFKSFFNTYAVKRHESTEVMLGRRDIYFPIFEEHLAKYGLPSDLKHLPIVESALKPNAVSRAGAVGLWQFMPATGKAFGLKINSMVDERKDPIKASDAAARFLLELHNRYKDWALALAAYNAGPGRVNRAMKKARSKNFWKIQKYLPRETRSYVPGFIAATYIAYYHAEHGLDPVSPDYELQVTDKTRVYESISFQDISAISGVPVHIIKTLNPSYNKNIIPASSEGNYVILPYHGIGAFVRHIYPNYNEGSQYYPNSEHLSAGTQYKTVATTYTVYPGDNLTKIAAIFNCKAENIRMWNNLPNNNIQPGRVLQIFERIAIVNRPKSRKLIELAQVDLLRAVSVDEKNKTVTSIRKISIPTKESNSGNDSNDNTIKDYVYYSIRRGESVNDIAHKFPGVSIDDILNDNNIISPSQVKSGKVLMIRKL